MKVDFGSVTDAVRALRRGGVVLVPTETVVGLVCTEAGLQKVYSIKGRDEGKPVALLCREAEEALSLAEEVPESGRRLARRLWPGPLTLVLSSRESGGTVGVRVPLGTVREVLEAYGAPLYATSANPSGEEPPRALGGVEREIIESVDVVVPGEPGNGEASAVVDVTGERPTLLRPSARLDEQKLQEMLAE
ncbi:Putative translation factor (SUA5) [Rubrobacter radiotolerans]|uniref:L-threonylcarbamoyladenylate synthase n=1 Tax=Rubrobacter radiotolerans TaxID=42256 RepID=A0A023X4D9_RUBRA|nr:L-threonylcarbamoyladenylate synthase [Rubrobacter radiotolerans]AHY46875.1 Putative translation factor (SUA5) [Rubrobacter radiotolerans]MDX5894280.1 L-threonylcarbamoyladenylate synthase [Rubrobacter radiotolerans]SMC05637.1 L-threonylcarbamoyladenylate synthase [Rubrobacter radiotolerans DSM 5868]